MDPAAENSQPTMLIPPNTANEAGSMKIPEPIMLPVTIEVVVQNPSAFFLVSFIFTAGLAWRVGSSMVNYYDVNA